MGPVHSFVALIALIIPATAAPQALTLTPYAPKHAQCPSTPLVRQAAGLSSSESSFVTARKTKADVALRSWVQKTCSEFGTGKLPTVGLTTSGGGYRSLLSGAGVIQGFDGRDSLESTGGLLQGLTYQAGLSGGSWLLSSLIGNDYPTVSSLRDQLWKPAFEDSLLLTQVLINAPQLTPVELDILAKQAAGFPPVLNDAWGRLLSYQLLRGAAGGVAKTLSGITGNSGFQNHDVPFPIITALGVQTFEGMCTPADNATQYELTPFEFGSWDRGVDAFALTKYLGSSLSNGEPKGKACIVNYDNLGYTLGTSSNLFNEVCLEVPKPSNDSLDGLLATIVDKAHAITIRDQFAVYPNPFLNYSSSSLVKAQKELTLVDGGEASQNNPIWPFLQPERKVDVLIVNDNSADTDDNYPDGSEILMTYNQSRIVGLTKMPEIPSIQTFQAKGIDKKAAFFGCNDASKITIVWLPNTNYTYDSGTSTFNLQYSQAETGAMIANGVEIATQGGKKGWTTCLACALMKKTGEKLAGACEECFDEYCYN
ncbi:MAG: hypothetical protein MMC23_002725 [Stictis urceolatum]|nr:hypothetical protein [Stictis urceolata]